MKVALTGANGALGTKYREMFPDTIPIEVRLDDKDSLERLSDLMSNVDVLIHTGANLHPKYLSYALNDNTILPIRIAEIAKNVNPKLHFIAISSMSILDEDRNIKDIKDMSMYATSKYLMEEFLKKQNGIPFTIVRFSTLFHENPERDGLSKIVYTAKIHNKVVAADCKRDFLPLDIACRWLNRLCKNHQWYNREINLATGHSVNMVDIANFLVKKYDVSFHRTSLPMFAHVCYQFDPGPPQSLEPIEVNIFDRVIEYYNRIKVEENGKTT